MVQPSFFNQILIWPIVNALMVFYNLLSAIKIPGALGFSIILLTLLIRAFLYPLMKTQLLSAKKMAQLKPQLDKLAKKHQGNRQVLQQAQLKLYREKGISPAAGCLPVLLQMPVLIALYRVFWQVLGNGNLAQTVESINRIVYHPALKIKALDLSFFGLNLAHRPSNWQAEGWWLLFVPLITAGLQWYQTELMSRSVPIPKKTKNKKPACRQARQKTKNKGQEDFGQEMQKQMRLMAPLMIGLVSFSFPVGLALYWNTFTLFGIFQSKKLKS